MFSVLMLSRTTIGGQFVVSTTQQGLDDFRGGGAKLSADPSFLAAKKQSGMGNETTGFLYANVKDALPQRKRSEEHTSELQSHLNLVCRLLLEKKNTDHNRTAFLLCSRRDQRPRMS